MDASGIYDLPHICRENGDVLATLDSGGGTITPEQILANARVMVASKDLMEAAENILEWIAELTAVASELRAAVDRARGGGDVRLN